MFLYGVAFSHVQDKEELMLNTVSCLTNLSYYLPVDEKEQLDNESSLKSLVLCKFIPLEICVFAEISHFASMWRLLGLQGARI